MSYDTSRSYDSFVKPSLRQPDSIDIGQNMFYRIDRAYQSSTSFLLDILQSDR